MKKLLLVVLIAGAATADPVVQNAGVSLGTVTKLNAPAGSGMVWTRTGSTGTGNIYCVAATNVLPGCVSTGTQTYAGTKTWNGVVSAASDGLYVTTLWDIGGGPLNIVGTINVAEPTTFVRIAANPNASDVNSRIVSFGANFAETGASYLERAYVDPFGTVRGKAFEQADGGFRLQGTRIQLWDHVSLPQTAHLSANTASSWVPSGGYESPQCTRFVAPGQFRRLTTVVGVSVPAAASDGGVNGTDGGAQYWFASVRNVTTGVEMCRIADQACSASGLVGVACGEDGGALFATNDDVCIRITNGECLVSPKLGVAGEYVGLP